MSKQNSIENEAIIKNANFFMGILKQSYCFNLIPYVIFIFKDHYL
jgi:hypothetical protein